LTFAHDPVAIQLLAVGATIAWVSIGSLALFAAVRAAMTLRISIDAELAGIDGIEHGEDACHGTDLSTALNEAVLLSGHEVTGEEPIVRSA
jgi:Amt family ammonium transporter